MSRLNYAPRNEYIGLGTTDTYAFDFKIVDLNQIMIVIVDDGGVEVDRVDGNGGGANYVSSVTFDPIVGSGTVILNANLPNEYRIIILLADDEPTQSFEFKRRGDFTLDKLERAFDWVMGPVQRLTYLIRRGVKLSDLDDVEDFNPVLPPGLPGTLSKIPATNDTGDGWAPVAQWTPVTDLQAAVAAAAAAALSEAAASASEIAAAASALAASNSEDNAQTSEDNAAGSAVAAASSAADALVYKNAAQASAAAALVSENNAEDALAAIGTAVSDAQDAASAASNSASDAASSAAIATTQAGNASTSASNAAASEVAAAASAADAAASAANGIHKYANLAAFPAAATAGDGVFATALDTDKFYRSNGTDWKEVGGGVTGYVNLAAFPAANTVDAGTLAMALDTYFIYYSNGTSWIKSLAGIAASGTDTHVLTLVSGDAVFAALPATGVPKYANLAAFPAAATAGDGAMGVALDTNIVYMSDGVDWLFLIASGQLKTIDKTTGDTDGIDVVSGSSGDLGSGQVNVKSGDTAGSSGGLALQSGASSTADSGQVDIATGQADAGYSGGMTHSTGPGIGSGNMDFMTGDTTGDVSGDIGFKTGNVTAPDTHRSGHITFETGTTSGTRGRIFFKDGTHGTAGYIWISQDTNGKGGWTQTLPIANGGTGATTAEGATAAMNAFVGDTGTGGTKGMVPAPAAGDAAANKFLNADGTFKTTPSYTPVVTTKGDLFGFSTVAARIPVGANNQVLVADSTQTLGVKWAAPAPGGVPIKFLQIGGNAATQEIDDTNFMEVYAFENALAQELYCTFKVPAQYVAGQQISLKIAFYSPSTSNDVLFKALATLIRDGVTAVTSTTNQYTSTNAAVTMATTANKYVTTTLDLTNASGQINSVAVAVGDMIKFKLYRDTDTDTAIVRLLPNCSEVLLT